MKTSIPIVLNFTDIVHTKNIGGNKETGVEETGDRGQGDRGQTPVSQIYWGGMVVDSFWQKVVDSFGQKGGRKGRFTGRVAPTCYILRKFAYFGENFTVG